MISRNSRDYPGVLLAVLFLTYLSASLNRIVINLLVEPIKGDFSLSDTEVSLLLGPAFIVVFALASFPMGILVDRVNRTRLLASAAAVWSVMTALSGLASSFGWLFLARAGIGLGQATLTPAGYSLISDGVRKERLGLALGIFITGGAVGAGLSFVLGGAVIGALSRHGDISVPLLGVMHPWRLTLLILAIPSVLLAPVVWAMPNPLRKTAAAAQTEQQGESALKRFYSENKALLARHHIAMGATNMVSLGVLSWVAPLFARVHGWPPSSIGIMAGTILLIANPIGLLGGGFIGDYLTRFGPHMRLVVSAVSLACGALCGLSYPLLPNPWIALVVYGFLTMFLGVPFGAGNAALQNVAPSEIRGRVSAFYYLIVTGCGMLGPTSIALASDRLFPSPTGIRYAIVIIVPATLIIASLLFLWAIPPYRRLSAQTESQLQRP